jgi:hypothetical protein
MSVCLSICTKEKQRGVLRFLWAEGVKGAAVPTFCELSIMETAHCPAEVNKYEWIEILKNGLL